MTKHLLSNLFKPAVPKHVTQTVEHFIQSMFDTIRKTKTEELRQGHPDVDSQTLLKAERCLMNKSAFTKMVKTISRELVLELDSRKARKLLTAIRIAAERLESMMRVIGDTLIHGGKPHG